MKTISIDIDNAVSLDELKDEFSKVNLQRGDSLHVVFSKSIESEIAILSVLVAILYIIQKQFEDYSNDLLDQIFKGKTVEDIERELMDEYDIELVIDSKEDQERRQWQQFSKSSLVKAYGEEEPEYTEDMVKEPNPEYNNKKKQ